MWVEAVGSQDSTYEAVRMPRLAATKAEETLIHVLWINAVLSCSWPLAPAPTMALRADGP